MLDKPPASSAAMFSPSARRLLGFVSTKSAQLAPRESASRPRAPEPAYRSSTRASGRSSWRILIQASRTRSRVGLTSEPLGALILRPRQRPATMRTSSGKREAGSGKGEAGDAACSCRARPDVCYPRLQVRFSAIIVPLEAKRDVDLRAGLELVGAISEAPPNRFE